MALDLRRIRVTVDVDGGQKSYENIGITASGMKYTNSLQNECEVTLYNLDTDTQNYILTQTSPYTLNRTPKTVLIEAGRQSYGLSKIYLGNIITSLVSQPPDIGLTLRCLTGNYLKGNIIARTQPGLVTLSQVAAQIAQDTNTILSFQATDKNLANFSYAGAVTKQVNDLNTIGGVNAYIDDGVLVIKDAHVARNNSLKILSVETGMIGVPEFTEQGIRVKYLLDNKSILGGALQIISKINPATNGIYIIYQLGFQIANRETPFYYIAEAIRKR